MSENLTIEREIFFNDEVKCPKKDYILIPLEGYQTKGCYDCEFFQGGTLNENGRPVILCSWKGENMQNDTRNKPYIDPANIDWGPKNKPKESRYVYKCARCGAEHDKDVEYLICIKSTSFRSKHHLCFECLLNAERWLIGRDELIKKPEETTKEVYQEGIKVWQEEDGG